MNLDNKITNWVDEITSLANERAGFESTLVPNVDSLSNVKSDPKSIVVAMVQFGKDTQEVIVEASKSQGVKDSADSIIKLLYLYDFGFSLALEKADEDKETNSANIAELKALYFEIYNNLHKKRCAIADYLFETKFLDKYHS